MFEKWGRKLAKGVKQEMLTDKGEGPITGILSMIVKVGVLVAVLLVDATGGSKKSSEPTTVIVNNYIYKEETK